MLNPRLAGRYAKSLIDLAIEKDQLDAIYNDMLFLQGICRSSKDFVSLLRSPVIKADKKDKILEAVTQDKVSAITAAFNKLLVRKGREVYLPEIVNALIQQYKDYRNIHIVKLTTAVPVGEDVKDSIVNKIRSVTNMQNIELNTEVKEDIIGGFVLEVGDQLIDASILYDLNNVKKQFRSNDFIYKIR